MAWHSRVSQHYLTLRPASHHLSPIRLFRNFPDKHFFPSGCAESCNTERFTESTFHAVNLWWNTSREIFPPDKTNFHRESDCQLKWWWWWAPYKSLQIPSGSSDFQGARFAVRTPDYPAHLDRRTQGFYRFISDNSWSNIGINWVLGNFTALSFRQPTDPSNRMP